MDESDALYEQIGAFRPSGLANSIAPAVDVEIVGITIEGPLVRVNLMDKYDRDNEVRSVVYPADISPVELVKRLNGTNFHFGER